MYSIGSRDINSPCSTYFFTSSLWAASCILRIRFLDMLLSSVTVSGRIRFTDSLCLPDDYRLSIDRECISFKKIYAMRTEAERYNSCFKATGQERLWVRSFNAAQNLNTITHIALLAVANVAICSDEGESYRSLKSVKRTAWTDLFAYSYLFFPLLVILFKWYLCDVALIQNHFAEILFCGVVELANRPPRKLERVHINRNVRISKRILRISRRKFADVLYVLQEFLTKKGAKFAERRALSVNVNTL